MTWLVPAILIFWAALFKAVADTLDHHFDTSVFKGLARSFWDPNVIVKTSPQILGYPLDAWHLANSGMLSCFLLLPFFYKKSKLKPWLEFIIAGVSFNLVFNLFYNVLLR